MKKLLFCFVFVFLVMTGGCAYLQELVDPPTVTFESMRFENTDLFQATPVFKFNVDNPNPMGLPVNKIAYNLKINNRKFINGSSDAYIRIKAASAGSVELPVTINYLDLFESAVDFIQSKSVDYTLSGNIDVGPFAIPYETTGAFDMPQLPKLTLNGINVSKMNLTGASLVVDIGIENDNPFAVNLNGLEYGIRLGGNQVATGVTESVPPIAEQGSSTLKIPLNLNFLELGRSAASLLSGSSTGYDFSGAMQFDVPKMGIKKFPFQKSGQVQFRR